MQNINYPSNYRYLMEATAGEAQGPSPSQRCVCKARRLAQQQAHQAEMEKQQLVPSALVAATTAAISAAGCGSGSIKTQGSSQMRLSSQGTTSASQINGSGMCPCQMRRIHQQQMQLQQQQQQLQQQQMLQAQQQQQLVPVQSPGHQQPQKTKCACGHSSSSVPPPMNTCSDDEFFSLSSASSEREENVPRPSRGGPSKCCSMGPKPQQQQSSPPQSSHQAHVQLQMPSQCGPPTGTATTADSTSMSQARNTAILQLLQEVVHLINEDGARSCNITPAKMRNIGNYGKEDSSADNGPFSSSLKLAYPPSRPGSSPTGSRMPSERSEGFCVCQARRTMQSQQAMASQQPMAVQQGMTPQQQQQALVSAQVMASQQAMQQALSQMQGLAQPMTIPLQFPCNLIISPVQYSPLDAQIPPGSSQIPKGSSQLSPTCCDHSPTDEALPPSECAPCAVQFKQDFDDSKGEQQNEVVKDMELIEEIAALAMQPQSGGEPNVPEDSGNCCDEGCSEANSKRCTLEGCICPVHGVFVPSEGRIGDDSSFVPNTQGEDCDEYCGKSGPDSEGPGPRRRSENTRKSGQSGGADCNTMEEECSCCHCRALRHGVEHNDCMTIATPQQAMENSSCTELKFFIDSIIMDLDAMDQARRKKQAEQDICPPKAKVCSRKSYPVTITDVTDLGTSSLYVKWCIHDCCGIGGYEIYVDGYLTNRYFHCNHEAAVVCDIDVAQPHKIVLLAQPKFEEHFDEICGCSSPADKGKQLLRKVDAEKMKKPDSGRPSMWTPSIYLYDPTNRDEMTPIRRAM